MRAVDEYRNHSARARGLARWLDLAATPLAGAPGADTRRSGTIPDPRRILLIRPDHAGDLLMATPAIRALRRARPESTIDVLASPWGAPAIRRNPDVDGILTIEATWFEPGRRDGPEPAALLASLAAVRRGRYDAALDLRGDVRSILIARLSGAPVRAGFSRLGLEALLTDCVPADPRADHITRNHAIASLVGAAPLEERRPVFAVTASARGRARTLLSSLPRGLPVLGVFPGTNRPSATWGSARFAEACRLLAARGPLAVAIGGREQDGAAGAALAAAMSEAAIPAVDLCGRTDLDEAAAVIEACDLLLANDSGAAHLSVAMRTPSVVIFGPTDPALLWTWDDPDRHVALIGPAPCARPCFDAACASDHGYAEIAPRLVADRLEALLARGRSGEAP